MPVVINEIVIKTNVESSRSEQESPTGTNGNVSVEEIVKQSVAKVLEILEERNER
ncbi:hypothetical protein MASR2M47_21350 [Draconibacterium sp.]|jgi:hypothetical protein